MNDKFTVLTGCTTKGNKLDNVCVCFVLTTQVDGILDVNI